MVPIIALSLTKTIIDLAKVNIQIFEFSRITQTKAK